jgi:hypothetical protein
MADDNPDQDIEVVGGEGHVQGKVGPQEVQEGARILQQEDIEEQPAEVQSRPEPQGTKGVRPVEGHILQVQQGTEVETMVHLETKALLQGSYTLRGSGHMMVNTLHEREVERLGVAEGLEGAHTEYSGEVPGEEPKTLQVDCRRSMSASAGQAVVRDIREQVAYLSQRQQS